MKHLFYFVAALVLCCGCSKREDPIKSYLAYNLADLESYEEIERSVLPSLFALPDTGLLAYSDRVVILNEAINENQRMSDSIFKLTSKMMDIGAARHAASLMDEDKELRDKWWVLTSEKDSLMGLIYEAFDVERNNVDSVYITGLRYRAKNNQGSMNIENKVFICASPEGPIIKVYDDSIYRKAKEVIIASKAGDIGFADNPYRVKAASKKKLTASNTNERAHT